MGCMHADALSRGYAVLTDKCVRAVEMRAVCNWVHNDAEGSFYQNRVVRARLCASPMPSFRSSRGRCAVARKVSLMHADRADLLLS
eukprot:6214818-Pleurochrysis_carterae.AAC.3